ncbi:MAG TPA: hypothetical protein VKB84_01785 [Candidatus Binataceae bacterium]|nr:hypothetical protein [Candidatus Binataceae bacterium]
MLVTLHYRRTLSSVLSYVPAYDILIYSAFTGSLLELQFDVWKLFAYQFSSGNELPLALVGRW